MFERGVGQTGRRPFHALLAAFVDNDLDSDHYAIEIQGRAVVLHDTHDPFGMCEIEFQAPDIRRKIMANKFMGFGALAAIAIGAITVPVSSQAADRVLKSVTALQQTNPLAKSFVENFVQAVNKTGKGIVDVTYIGGQEVVPPRKAAAKYLEIAHGEVWKELKKRSEFHDQLRPLLYVPGKPNRQVEITQKLDQKR